MRSGIPSRTIERLIVYRRLLVAKAEAGSEHVYSHELAAMANVTPVQVRRDLMVVGCSGSPRRGYSTGELASRIGQLLEDPEGQNVVLVGLGNMGRAVLSYLAGRSPAIRMVASFDADPAKFGRVIAGCRCYDVQELADKVSEFSASIGIVAVPGSQAQAVADALVEAGVTGILNFAPAPLRVRSDVYVEQVDITRALEKVAHFAKLVKSRKV